MEIIGQHHAPAALSLYPHLANGSIMFLCNVDNFVISVEYLASTYCAEVHKMNAWQGFLSVHQNCITYFNKISFFLSAVKQKDYFNASLKQPDNAPNTDIATDIPQI
jgi:hypothetical protein